MGMKEWCNGPSFLWNGVEDGSGQHFWGGRLEWKAFQKIRMVPQSDPNPPRTCEMSAGRQNFLNYVECHGKSCLGRTFHRARLHLLGINCHPNVRALY